MQAEIQALRNRVESLEQQILQNSFEKITQKQSIPTLRGEKSISSIGLPEITREPTCSYENIDLAVLVSNPLVIEHDNQVIPFHGQIKSSMRNWFIDILKRNNIGADLRFDSANVENFVEIYDSCPKIIHIDCHGDFSQNGDFYLAFESNITTNTKKIGFLDKVTGERLKRILSNKRQHQTLQVVVVCACYSANVGQVFLDAGFPCVVVIHQNTQVLGEATTIFAQHFYTLLFRQWTIRDAFERAKTMVNDENNCHQNCCCSHCHKNGCLWERYAIRKGIARAHREHSIPHRSIMDCNCVQSGVNKNDGFHKIDCIWANKFLSVFNPRYKIDLLSKKHIVCCCSPELAHDEGQKFLLLTQEDSIKDQIVFGYRAANVEIRERLPFNKPPQLSKQNISRHVLLQKVIQRLASQDKEHRLIVIQGQEGSGKSSLVQIAAEYVFERRVFMDGVVYMDFRGKSDVVLMVDQIAAEIAIPGLASKEELVRCINQSRILLIFENLNSIMNENRRQFIEFINFVLEHTELAKIIVTSDEQFSEFEIFHNTDPFILQELSKQEAALLLHSLAEQFLPDIQRRKIKELQKHPILDCIRRWPGTIKSLAPLLKEKTLDQLVEECKAQNDKKDDWSLSVSIQHLKHKHDKGLQLLTLISYMPTGLTEIDLERLNLDYDWKNVMNILLDQSRSGLQQCWLLEQQKLEDQILYYAQPNVAKYMGQWAVDNDMHDKTVYKISEYYSKLLKAIVLKLEAEAGFEFRSNLSYSNFLSGIKMKSSLIIQKPKVTFQLMEMNFWYLLDLAKNLKSFQEFKQYILDIAICMAATQLMLNKKSEAPQTLQKAIRVCETHNFNEGLSKLKLLQAAMFLNLYSNNFMEALHQAWKFVSEARNSYLHMENIAGEAECFLLQSLIKQAIQRCDRSPMFKNKTIDVNSINEDMNQALKKFRDINDQKGMARVILAIEE